MLRLRWLCVLCWVQHVLATATSAPWTQWAELSSATPTDARAATESKIPTSHASVSVFTLPRARSMILTLRYSSTHYVSHTRDHCTGHTVMVVFWCSFESHSSSGGVSCFFSIARYTFCYIVSCRTRNTFIDLKVKLLLLMAMLFQSVRSTASRVWTPVTACRRWGARRASTSTCWTRATAAPVHATASSVPSPRTAWHAPSARTGRSWCPTELANVSLTPSF